jgi:hypothetical protein
LSEVYTVNLKEKKIISHGSCSFCAKRKKKEGGGANDSMATQLWGRKRLVEEADFDSVPNNAPMPAEEKTQLPPVCEMSVRLRRGVWTKVRISGQII